MIILYKLTIFDFEHQFHISYSLKYINKTSILFIQELTTNKSN